MSTDMILAVFSLLVAIHVEWRITRRMRRERQYAEDQCQRHRGPDMSEAATNSTNGQQWRWE